MSNLKTTPDVTHAEENSPNMASSVPTYLPDLPVEQVRDQIVRSPQCRTRCKVFANDKIFPRRLKFVCLSSATFP